MWSARAFRVGDIGAGEFYAARKPVLGASRVVRWCLGVTRIGTAPTTILLRTVNGRPGLWTERSPKIAREGPRAYTRLSLDAAGKISEIFINQATAKLLNL